MDLSEYCRIITISLAFMVMCSSLVKDLSYTVAAGGFCAALHRALMAGVSQTQCQFVGLPISGMLTHV